MKCLRCKTEIPNNSNYCMVCGAKQGTTVRPKSRGNGQGTAFKRGKTWTAQIVLSYSADESGMHKKTCSKGGFATKKEALEYIPKLRESPTKRAIKLSELYDRWLPTHRASKSTLDCYKAAWRYYAPIAGMYIQDITIDDLQECVDDCPKGKRTKQNMRTLCGLLYKYAIPRNFITLNLGEYIKVTGDTNTERIGLPMEAVDLLWEYVDAIPFTDYVLCQIYMGFRPSEFLSLDAQNYNRQEKAFMGGAKTEAGKNRTVTISPKIQLFVDRLIKDKISGPVFCNPDGTEMSIVTYRKNFYNVLSSCGIDNPEIDGRKLYTPHSCRHTFATLLKNVSAPDKDKLELIGHSSGEMLRYYQDVTYEDLRKITDNI